MLALPSALGKDQADNVRALDQRPEGAYLSCEKAGLPPYDVNLFTIERVNGDGSVSSIGLTRGELRSVIVQYKMYAANSLPKLPALPPGSCRCLICQLQRANAGTPQPAETPERSPNTNA